MNLYEDVNFDDPKCLKLTYHEILSNLSILSKAYKKLRKDFKNLSKEYTELKKAHQDINLLTEPDQDNKDYDTLKEKESQLLLENEKVSKEHDTLMKIFKILEDKFSICK